MKPQLKTVGGHHRWQQAGVKTVVLVHKDPRGGRERYSVIDLLKNQLWVET